MSGQDIVVIMLGDSHNTAIFMNEGVSATFYQDAIFFGV